MFFLLLHPAAFGDVGESGLKLCLESAAHDSAGFWVATFCRRDVLAELPPRVTEARAQANFAVFLVLREDGWKVWGVY
jgi:hypothetical protein